MFDITKKGDTPSQHPYSEYSKILVRDGYNWGSSGENRKEDYEAEYFEYEKDSRARIIALVQRKTETETTPPLTKYSKYSDNSKYPQTRTTILLQAQYSELSENRIIALVQRKTETETTPPQALVASWPNSGIGQGSTCLVPPEKNGHFTFSFCADLIN